jgi:lipoate-protein ligase A
VAARWRLLLDGPASGPWNMAVDAALLAAAQRGAAPTLRFYSWDGAWLSLGLAQALAPERRAACRAAGIGVVQRSTGGRAVLHGADLTYAVAAPVSALPRGLRATYARLGEALREGLAALGVAAERCAAGAPTRRPPAFDCFGAPAPDELSVGGCKLVGSAQRRSAGGVLQHGSLRLAPDPPGARAAAGLAGDAATSLAELGFALGAERVREALVAAFARVLDLRFETASLGERELAEAALLADASPAVIPRGFSRAPAAGR